MDEISTERSPAIAAAALRTWQWPQCPFRIECAPAVLEKIRQEVEKERNLPRGPRESGGVLFGVHEPDVVRILALRTIPCEHSIGPGFVLSEHDEKGLKDLISTAAADPEVKDLGCLGWYHSHIRSRIYLSARDLQIHSRHFNAPFQVALVVRPESDRLMRAGFFFREASGQMRTEASYGEFSIEPPRPPAQTLKPSPVYREDQSHRRSSSEKAEPHPQTETVCPKCGSAHLRRSRTAGPTERLRELFGYYPFRCHECLSRSFVKTSSNLLERVLSPPKRRREERQRALHRTRREILLWGGGVVGFLMILYYLIRDTGPRPDAP